MVFLMGYEPVRFVIEFIGHMVVSDLKYEIVSNDSWGIGDHKVYRVRALKDFGRVRCGDLGGYVANERNLSQTGLAWVYENASVRDNARLEGDAEAWGLSCIQESACVSGQAVISGSATVSGNSLVHGSAIIKDSSLIGGNAEIFDDAIVCGRASVFGDAKVYGKASIQGTASIYDHARIFEGACILGGAAVGGSASISGETNIGEKAVVSGSNSIGRTPKKWNHRIFSADRVKTLQPPR